MKKRGIIFTKKKHPLIAIMSTVLGAISLIAIVYGIIASFTMGGEVPHRYGVALILCFGYTIVGLVLALYSFKKQEAFYLFSVIGTVLNGVCLLAEGFLLWIAG
ncbi:MAG: DUF6142 family protein [Lachnospiraceae bacterium]|nr:DUF6142 family protein [Lachnospiraceae bacterium]